MSGWNFFIYHLTFIILTPSPFGRGLGEGLASTRATSLFFLFFVSYLCFTPLP